MFKFNRSIISSAVLSIVMSALVVLSVVSGNAKMPLSSRNFYSIIGLIRSQLDNVPNTEENVIQTAVGSICTDELDDLLIRVYDSNEKRVKEMFLEDYIMGVVYAEMNLRNNIEALKAQAVASRTYTLYKFYNDGEVSISQRWSSNLYRLYPLSGLERPRGDNTRLWQGNRSGIV